MITVSCVSTSDAADAFLTEARRLMARAFAGDFTDEDWKHSVGGVHVAALDGDELVAHASVVERTLEIGGRPLRCGYVEAVATEPSRQGEGLGTKVMKEVGRVIRAEFEMGGLSTGELAFYERLGWERWRGVTFVRDGPELIRTPEDDGGIMVLRFGPSAGVRLDSTITCGMRPGDVW